MMLFLIHYFPEKVFLVFIKNKPYFFGMHNNYIEKIRIQ